jgi:hypothetical protein
LLFGLIVAVLLIMALANLNTLLRTTTIYLPLLGEFTVTLRLLGMLGLAAVAWLFWLLNNLQTTQSQAESANYLKKIEDLRLSLDKNESERFRLLEERLNSRLDRLRDELAADIGHASEGRALPVLRHESLAKDQATTPAKRGLFGLGRK